MLSVLIFAPSTRNRTCMALCSAFLFILCTCALPSTAQIPAPSVPDNGPAPTTPYGTPPGASTQGTDESVDFATGALNVYIPLLTLPQRGGANLTLGYISHSNDTTPQQTMSISTSVHDGGDNGQNYVIDNISYDDYYGATRGQLFINIPLLTYTSEWMGDRPTDQAGAIESANSVFCLANYTFYDWEGNGHPFENINDCNNSKGPVNGSVTNVSDSSDGSGYRLNTTNMNDPYIQAPDGTIYGFNLNLQGAPTAPNQIPGYNPVSTVTDPNGNQIQISAASGNTGSFQIKDTIGRMITAGPSGITYTDSNGESQSITLTTTSSSQTAPYYPYLSCIYSGPPQQVPYPNPTVTSPTEATGNTSISSAVLISLPTGSGTTKSYTLTFDQYGRMSKIVYPSGGYTRYDYSDITQTENSAYHATMVDGNVTCNLDLNEVAHKYVCPSSTGSCSTEQTTTYGPPTLAYTNTGNPYNSSMSATDPLGQSETHTYGQTSTIRTNPQETSIVTRDASGTLIQTVSKTYPPPPNNSFYGENIVFPSQVATTLNSVSPNLTTTVSYAYQQLSEDIGAYGGAYTVPTGRPTKISEYDYTNTLFRTTSQSWEPSSAFNSNVLIEDRLETKTVAAPSGSVSKTTTYGYDTLGNLTSVMVAGGGQSGYTTSYKRNSYGELTQLTDPAQNVTLYGYNDNWSSSSQTCVPANSSAYPTSITDSLQHVTTYAYNACTGTVSSIIDPNHAATTYSYDSLGRVLSSSVTDASGPTIESSAIKYVDSIPNEIVETQPVSSGNSLTTVTVDGLGRTIQTAKSGVPNQGAVPATVFIGTTYDALGRVQSVTNPYTAAGEASDGATQFQYDVFNRQIVETMPDNSTVTWCYNGSSLVKNLYCSKLLSGKYTTAAWVDMTDENGHHWQDVMDSRGDLVAVMEPNPDTSSGIDSLETDYQYDVFSNLTTVDQWGGAFGSSGDRSRAFRYDGLSRIDYIQTPETGVTTYSYYTSSNGMCSGDPSVVCSRTDARGIITTYAYDSLNRLTQRSYNDGVTLPVNYVYDQTSASVHPKGDYGLGTESLKNTIGRLSSEYEGTQSPGVSAKTFSYDAVGRSVSIAVCGDVMCTQSPLVQLSSHSYDLAGNMLSSGTFWYNDESYSYDAEGRLSGMTVLAGPNQQYTTVVGNTVWGPVGPTSISYGNGDTETLAYTDRLRIKQKVRVSATNSSQYSFDLQYDLHGNLSVDNEAGFGYSGQLTFSYDPLNRVSLGVLPAYSIGCQYIYDHFGNLLAEVPGGMSGASCVNVNRAVGGSTAANANAISGYCYDASGNLLDAGACPDSSAYQDTSASSVGAHQYSWDAENRLIAANHGAIRYVYDPEGKRIGENTSSTNTDTLYDEVTGKPIRQNHYNESSGVADMWFGDQHVGYISGDTTGDSGGNQPAVVNLSVTDWLGNERERVDPSDNLIGGYYSYPYGEILTTLYGSDSDDVHFTGKERDLVADDVTGNNGLDFFGARYYSATTERWMSPDWSESPTPLPYANAENPQMLDLYTYVTDNPLTFSDPTGHGCYSVGESWKIITTTTGPDQTVTNTGSDADREICTKDNLSAELPLKVAERAPVYRAPSNMLNYLESCEGTAPGGGYGAYNDTNGNCTTGYGHLVHLHACSAQEIALYDSETQAQASAALQADYASASQWVSNSLSGLNAGQQNAVVDMDFNMGPKRLKSHDVWKDIRSGNVDAVPSAIMSLRAGGPGIATRRANEVSMWNGGAVPSRCY